MRSQLLAYLTLLRGDRQRLPTSHLVLIDAGHFVWEEAAATYASTVLDSITGNWP